MTQKLIIRNSTGERYSVLLEPLGGVQDMAPQSVVTIEANFQNGEIFIDIWSREIAVWTPFEVEMNLGSEEDFSTSG